jgi:hypothetical protein
MSASAKRIYEQRTMPSFVAAGAADNTVSFESTMTAMPSSLRSVGIAPAAVAAVTTPVKTVAAAVASPRSITPSAAKRVASPHIHERLLERGRLYEERQEARREKAVRDELRQCRSVPRISKMGHNIERDTDIMIRLNNLYKEKQQLEEFEKQILRKREDGVMSKWFEPTISKRGKRAEGLVHQRNNQSSWEYKKRMRMEELRREKLVKEMTEMRGAPDVDPRSQILAARKREKEGLAGYSHAEAMLERDRLQKLARWEENQRAAVEQLQATPRITEFAATLPRSGDVAERLIRYGEEREQRRRERERQRLQEEQVEQVDHDRSFDLSTFAGRNEAFVQRREEKLRRVAEEESRGLYRPAVNPVSESIVSSLPTSTMERLTTPLSAARSRTPTRLSAPNSSAARAQTPPSRRSSQAVQGDLYERLQLAEARRKLRVEVSRAEQEARELEECSFQPQTTTHYYPPSHDTNLSMYARMKQWDQQREERIQQAARAAQEAEQLAEQRYSPIKAASPPPVSHNDVNNIAGFNEFVQRQAAGRSQQADSAPSSSAPGASVRRAPTVPEAPLLGRERQAAGSHSATTVLSLARPVNPPPLGMGSDFAAASPVMMMNPKESQRRTDLTPLAQHLFRSSESNTPPPTHNNTDLDDDEYVY